MNSLSRQLLPLVAALTCAVATAKASQTYVVEPDNYVNGTVLNNVLPFVTLSTGAFSDNRPTFDVTAETVGVGATASTGSKVFAHVGIPFWNTNRTFRMDFAAAPEAIEIDYIASGHLSQSFAGRLEGYAANGNLIAAVETPLLAEDQFATLVLNAPGVAYALAYPPLDPFGRLDNLRIVIPEPVTFYLVATGLLLLPQRRR